MGVGIGNAVGTYAATAPEKSIAKSSKKFTQKNGTTPHKPHLLTHGTKEWRNQQYHVVLVGRSVGLPAAKRWGGVWSSHQVIMMCVVEAKMGSNRRIADFGGARNQLLMPTHFL